MQIFIPHRWVQSIVPAALLLALTLAQAQTPTNAKKPQQVDPANADAPVAALTYRSSFTHYRPLLDEPVAAWRSSNDQIAKISGWRVYAKEARQPDAPAAVPASAPAKDHAKDHAGHHGGQP
jgi:hypothetical protein